MPTSFHSSPKPPCVPVASTSRVPYTASPHTRTLSTRSFRLTPTVRSRLTNASFVLAATLSVVTVSLGMSGSIQPGGVALPCPARSQVGVGAQEGSGTGEQRWFAEREAKQQKRRRQWLEDPVPIARKDNVLVAPAAAAAQASTAQILPSTAPPPPNAEREVKGDSTDDKSRTWKGWTTSLWRSS